MAEKTKPYHDMNIVRTKYNIQCDPYLGLEIFTIITTPCDLIEYSNAMYLPWNPSLSPKYQTRYYSVTIYQNHQILGKHNDLAIMDFINKGTYKEEY